MCVGIMPVTSTYQNNLNSYAVASHHRRSITFVFTGRFVHTFCRKVKNLHTLGCSKSCISDGDITYIVT